MITRLLRIIPLALVAASFLTSPTHAATFTPLGHLDYGRIRPIDLESAATGVSADGFTVVGYSTSIFGGKGFGTEAFVWSKEDGMVGLGDLPGGSLSSAAFAISADGTTAVGRSWTSYTPPLTQFYDGFRWNKQDGIEPIGAQFGTRFQEYASAIDVSDDGAIAVGSYRGARVWDSENGSFALGDLPGGRTASAAVAVSGDGSVIAGISNSINGDEAFIWNATDGMIGLGDLPGRDFMSQTRGISSDGSTVVGVSRGEYGPEAFVWNATDGMFGLGGIHPAFNTSDAFAVSGDGSIVVGNANGVLGREAFVWDKGNGMRGVRDILIASGIDMTDWMLRSANGISDDGRFIVGSGLNPSRKTEAWIVELDIVVPEPSSVLLTTAAIAIMLLQRCLYNKYSHSMQTWTRSA